MSLPKTVFIDTSVFHGQSFNFASAQMTAFVEAAKAKGVSLLLPAPIEKEIVRHMNDQREAACNALVEAQRKAPFLRKWKSWPIPQGKPLESAKRSIAFELRTVSNAEWKGFLENFQVVRLDYKGIDLGQIMTWYEGGRPPFGPGAKRKEFPDAISLAAVLLHAGATNSEVAVISQDGDFKKACDFETSLLHFESLAAITEALISESGTIEKIKATLEVSNETLTETIEGGFVGLSFYPEEDPNGEVQDVTVDEVEVLEARVIALGHHEASIAFEASVGFSAFVSYDDPDTVFGNEEDFPMVARLRGCVSDYCSVSGMAKLRFSDDWSSIVQVILLEFDKEEICVSGRPEEIVW